MASWRLSFLIVPLLFVFFCSGCQSESNCQDAIGCVVLPPGAPLNIGVDKSTTGDTAGISQIVLASLDFAVQKTPSLLGHSIHFIPQESPCNPQSHLQAASILSAQSDLPVIIGPICQANAVQFIKLTSDAGQILLSPVPLIDSPDLPGWFQSYPSLKVLAGAVESLLSDYFPQRGIEIITLQKGIGYSFSTTLCQVYAANNMDCRITELVDENFDDPAIISLLENRNDGQVMIVAPVDVISEASGLVTLEKSSSLVFFDAELPPAPVDLPRVLQESKYITLNKPERSNSLFASLPSDQPLIYGLFAFDSYQILLKALNAVSYLKSDGAVIIPRQGLRDALQSIRDNNVDDKCQALSVCPVPENFLTLIQPDQKDKP
jgi:hypothetical protein